MHQALIDALVRERRAIDSSRQADPDYSGVPTTFDDPDVHYLVRVYASGDAKHSIRRGDQSDWVSYNRGSRPGCALFLDGKCLHSGYLKAEETEVIEALIAADMAAGIPMSLDVVASQVDRWGLSDSAVDRYVGYRPERDRAPFRESFRAPHAGAPPRPLPAA